MFGAARTPQKAEPPKRADAIADVVLTDTDGNDVRVGDLWAERPAVLVFLRHYG